MYKASCDEINRALCFSHCPHHLLWVLDGWWWNPDTKVVMDNLNRNVELWLTKRISLQTPLKHSGIAVSYILHISTLKISKYKIRLTREVSRWCTHCWFPACFFWKKISQISCRIVNCKSCNTKYVRKCALYMICDNVFVAWSKS